MSVEGRGVDHEQPRDIRDITEDLFGRLPQIGRQLSEKYLDQSIESNRRFTENPDDPADHKPDWHQWGLITHMKMVEKSLREQVPAHLEEWGIKEQVMEHMDEKIGNRSKWELMQIALPLHDVGKFATRQVKEKPGGEVKWNYIGHEKKSAEIIHFPAFSDMLRREYGLSSEQIAYVAKCAEHHYDLGLPRDKGWSPKNSAFAHVEGPVFEQHAAALRKEFAGFEPELGVLFLADSLGKTNIHIEAESDEEVEAQQPEVLRKINEEGLDPRITQLINQTPINVATSRRFLKSWAEESKSE